MLKPNCVVDRRPLVSNEELVARAQRGCLASFEEILRRFQSPLLHFLQQRGRVAEAEDVLQETFHKAYRFLHMYRHTARFSTWLYTLARRTSINYHRRWRPQLDPDALERATSPAGDPCDIAQAAENRQRLWRMASLVLAEEEQTALWLYYVEDLSIADVAAVLEKGQSAVKTLMFRARKKLLPFVMDLEPEGVRRTPVWPAMEVPSGP